MGGLIHMLFVTRNPIVAFASLAVSLIIFGVVYFTVIKPSSDTANNAVKQSLNQADQAIKNSGFGNTAAGQRAEKLTACISAAGTDTAKRK